MSCALPQFDCTGDAPIGNVVLPALVLDCSVPAGVGIPGFSLDGYGPIGNVVIPAFLADCSAPMGVKLPVFVVDCSALVGVRMPPFALTEEPLAGTYWSTSTVATVIAVGTAEQSTGGYAEIPRIVAVGTAKQVVGSYSIVVGVVASGMAGPAGVSDAQGPQVSASGVGVQLAVSALSKLRIVATGEGLSVRGDSRSGAPAPLAYGLALAGSASSATAPRILAAAQGYSGAVGTSDIALPLLQYEGTAPQEAVGQSVTVRIPLILAKGTAQQLSVQLGGVSMHTERQALTTYSNYPFNSFALFNGVYLAAGDGGLFALAGATDDGAFIDAAARVGMTDFGTSHLKRVDRLYVGYRTDGDLVLRVFTDEVTVRDYALKSSGAVGLHGNHVRIGKGVQARYWQFEIQNTNGADFELNMIEVKPQVLRRRVGGGDA